ncbi:MAG TPA: DEAD/DEAH box helicase [Acidimicrobiales bacterium]|nr:DEAD/DEAH box helicase [Acidimicrobiales bacterium]
MIDVIEALEAAAWAEAEGIATEDQLALLEGDKRGWRRALERLLDQTEDDYDEVLRLRGEERDQVIADFEGQLARLDAAYDRLVPPPPPPPPTVPVIAEIPGGVATPVGEVQLQASWTSGRVVVWAAGPGADPADNDGLADRLEAIGGPQHGWVVHADVTIPGTGGVKAAALSIPVHEALGWLVSVGAAEPAEHVGPSVTWLGRVAVEAVRSVAKGAVVPSLKTRKRVDAKLLELGVSWAPALVDETHVAALAEAMPGPVTALAQSAPRTVVMSVWTSVVDAVVRTAAARLELPAPPPTTNTSASVAEAFLTRLDGSAFEAPVAAAAEVMKRLDRWVKPVAHPASDRTRLIVQLEPPDRGNAWYLAVLGRGADGNPLPVEVALADSKDTKAMADELLRLERAMPVLLRPGGLRRGQVYLSQDEAWELMTTTGPILEAAGFEVRVPKLSRRKPAPGLKLFTGPTGDSVVGAHQLSDVRWSVVFDDVELTAADIARLASEARPLVQSHGRWVELDRADLREAAAALAERANKTKLSGAEILRHAVGLEGSALGGGLTVEGSGWATDLLRKAQEIPTDPITTPDGFLGELRSYQAEALAWLGFLDAVSLGGCLALDMGLGKTPTMLAHLGRTAGRGGGAALVIAPPAVVGNWAAEAARFTPGLRVVVHHGSSRSSADQLAEEVSNADVVITTYGTAVRDIEALSGMPWDRVVLDEAQAVKNPANETAQQLRRIPARTRVALTGTPIENGLGDLWAILDFTNPGLVGPRPAFIAQLSGEGSGEAALRALNGILVFRRTKKEPLVAAELPDRIDELDHCTMTPEQIGLYQAVLDGLVADTTSAAPGAEPKQGAILAAITALKQICNHPAAYQDDGRPLEGRSGKLARLEEIVETVFAADERILVFTHFAQWGMRLADHLTAKTGVPISCYHGSLARGARDRMIEEFQAMTGPGALVLSLKAGGTGLNLTAASHVVLYDRWWNPAVEDQARDRAWRIGQTRTVVSHRLVCPGTVDERVEEVVAGKRHVADLVLPKSSSLADLDAEQLRVALGLRPDQLLTEEDT